MLLNFFNYHKFVDQRANEKRRTRIEEDNSMTSDWDEQSLLFKYLGVNKQDQRSTKMDKKLFLWLKVRRWSWTIDLHFDYL